ncbi:hypothetical protein ACFQQH_07575 [Bhargavaea changchunensis]|uniref:Uncharacterized protein n=1 Tax=Bhargavaea changchunensis TaxID=2134037 RepID=A0ABW2NGZ3_9BACL|nr:hypothetical protein [Bhargavaea sp. CC-171006]
MTWEQEEPNDEVKTSNEETEHSNDEIDSKKRLPNRQAFGFKVNPDSRQLEAGESSLNAGIQVKFIHSCSEFARSLMSLHIAPTELHILSLSLQVL